MAHAQAARLCRLGAGASRPVGPAWQRGGALPRQRRTALQLARARALLPRPRTHLPADGPASAPLAACLTAPDGDRPCQPDARRLPARVRLRPYRIVPAPYSRLVRTLPVLERRRIFWRAVRARILVRGGRGGAFECIYGERAAARFAGIARRRGGARQLRYPVAAMAVGAVRRIPAGTAPV